MFQVQKYNSANHEERTVIETVQSEAEGNAVIAKQPIQLGYSYANVPPEHPWFVPQPLETVVVPVTESVAPKYVPDGQQSEPMLLEGEPVPFAQIMQHELKMSQAARIAEHEMQLKQQAVMQRLLSGEAS